MAISFWFSTHFVFTPSETRVVFLPSPSLFSQVDKTWDTSTSEPNAPHSVELSFSSDRIENELSLDDDDDNKMTDETIWPTNSTVSLIKRARLERKRVAALERFGCHLIDSVRLHSVVCHSGMCWQTTVVHTTRFRGGRGKMFHHHRLSVVCSADKSIDWAPWKSSNNWENKSDFKSWQSIYQLGIHSTAGSKEKIENNFTQKSVCASRAIQWIYGPSGSFLSSLSFELAEPENVL